METITIHWQEPRKLREFDKELLCLTKDNRIKVVTLYGTDYSISHWKYLVEEFKIKYWCFLNDIVPQKDKILSELN